MLMSAKVGTLEHRNVALATLEHDRPAQGFCKTETVVSLQDKDCREVAGHCLEFAGQGSNLEDCCKSRPQCKTVEMTKFAKALRWRMVAKTLRWRMVTKPLST